MSDTDTQVLAALRGLHPLLARPAPLARVLNRDAPCVWCPVGPPRKGDRCASVPVESRRRVEAALRRLVRAGLVAIRFPRTRMMHYVATEAP